MRERFMVVTIVVLACALIAQTLNRPVQNKQEQQAGVSITTHFTYEQAKSMLQVMSNFESMAKGSTAFVHNGPDKSIEFIGFPGTNTVSAAASLGLWPQARILVDGKVEQGGLRPNERTPPAIKENRSWCPRSDIHVSSS